MTSEPAVELVVTRSAPSWARALFGALATAIMPIAAVAAPRAVSTAQERFVICYGQDAPLEAFVPYGRAVLDADKHPLLAPLKARGISLFGYISIGEADEARDYFDDVKATGLLLGANPNWPGAQYVDLRKPAWRELLLDRVIPRILEHGFQGLFLDTLDDAAFLENADPVGNRGMVEAGAAIVRAIHARFPAVPLMLNRAFEVAALVPDQLESMLAESLASNYDFKTQRYHQRSQADLNWGLTRLAELQARNPLLRIHTLDYWDPADRAGVARLYEQERRAGFIPYVATIDLQRIVPEPAAARGIGRAR